MYVYHSDISFDAYSLEAKGHACLFLNLHLPFPNALEVRICSHDEVTIASHVS